jgi:hypothetical protein
MNRGRERSRDKDREKEGGIDRNRHRENDGERQRERSRYRNRATGYGSDRNRHTDSRRESKDSRTSVKFNIELNKNLMRISDKEELCSYISKHAAEFNHVNVATAFRQVLNKPRWGAPPNALEQTLQTLEESRVGLDLDEILGQIRICPDPLAITSICNGLRHRTQ